MAWPPRTVRCSRSTLTTTKVQWWDDDGVRMMMGSDTNCTNSLSESPRMALSEQLVRFVPDPERPAVRCAAVRAMAIAPDGKRFVTGRRRRRDLRVACRLARVVRTLSPTTETRVPVSSFAGAATVRVHWYTPRLRSGTAPTRAPCGVGWTVADLQLQEVAAYRDELGAIEGGRVGEYGP